MKFEGVTVWTAYGHDGTRVIPGFGAWTQLDLKRQHPSEIVLNVEAQDAEGVTFGIFLDSTTGETLPHVAGPWFNLKVPVMWRAEVPTTRSGHGKEEDNFDVIILQPNGHFTEIQVGLVTRGGKFFLTCQIIWQGWITFYTEGKEEVVGFTPSAPEHAYPGADYRRIWAGTDKILEFVGSVVKATTEALGGETATPQAAAPTWKSATLSPREGWIRGTVTYFNMVSGSGQILGENGEKCFVHFSKILGGKNGEMKVLVPMSGVYFRSAPPLTPDQEPRVKSCQPA